MVLLALYAAVVAIWGTTWSAIRTAVATVSPITASRLPHVPLRYPRGQWRLFVLVTLAYFVVPFALMNLGSDAIPSGLAAVLFATVAIFIMLSSVPRSPGRRTRAGS